MTNTAEHMDCAHPSIAELFARWRTLQAMNKDGAENEQEIADAEDLALAITPITAADHAMQMLMFCGAEEDKGWAPGGEFLQNARVLAGMPRTTPAQAEPAAEPEPGRIEEIYRDWRPLRDEDHTDKSPDGYKARAPKFRAMEDEADELKPRNMRELAMQWLILSFDGSEIPGDSFTLNCLNLAGDERRAKEVQSELLRQRFDEILSELSEDERRRVADFSLGLKINRKYSKQEA